MKLKHQQFRRRTALAKTIAGTIVFTIVHPVSCEILLGNADSAKRRLPDSKMTAAAPTIKV